jgi:hypothetical protein
MFKFFEIFCGCIFRAEDDIESLLKSAVLLANPKLNFPPVFPNQSNYDVANTFWGEYQNITSVIESENYFDIHKILLYVPQIQINRFRSKLISPEAKKNVVNFIFQGDVNMNGNSCMLFDYSSIENY